MTTWPKHCPFCGFPGLWLYDRDCHKLGCINNECPARPAVYSTDQAKAVEMWNKRY